jgi:hypothetical protein
MIAKKNFIKDKVFKREAEEDIRFGTEIKKHGLLKDA